MCAPFLEHLVHETPRVSGMNQTHSTAFHFTFLDMHSNIRLNECQTLRSSNDDK